MLLVSLQSGNCLEADPGRMLIAPDCMLLVSLQSGNCLEADPSRSCAYPCFDQDVTYGIAVHGFARTEASLPNKELPVRIDVLRESEPDPREGHKPVPMHAHVDVSGRWALEECMLSASDGMLMVSLIR